MAQTTITYSDLRARFDVWLRDTANTAWSIAEKDEIFASSFNDPYVFIVDTDSTLQTATQTLAGGAQLLQPTYDITGTPIYQVMDVEIDTAQNGFPFKVDRQGWRVINGTLRFRRDYTAIPNPGYTIYLTGKRKLQSNDNIPQYLEEYILHLACAQAFEMLKAEAMGSFVKNDRTIAEMNASIAEHRARIQELRRTLATQYSAVY